MSRLQNLHAPAPGSAPQASPAGVFCFSVQAEAEPGVMPRVLELFAKRGLVPSRWVSGIHGPGQRGGRNELSIDIQVEGLTPRLGDTIARCLRQICGVGAVLTSQKSPGDRAEGGFRA